MRQVTGNRVARHGMLMACALVMAGCMTAAPPPPPPPPPPALMGANVTFSLAPANGRLWVIGKQAADLCDAAGYGHANMARCTAWNGPFTDGITLDLVGNHRIAARWPDGKRCDRMGRYRPVDDNPYPVRETVRPC